MREDEFERRKINGETWYACGSLRSKEWAQKHAQPIKAAGGKYKIVEHKDDFQVFTNKKKFARMGTIFEGGKK